MFNLDRSSLKTTACQIQVHRNGKSAQDLENSVENSNFIANCELFLSMLRTELGLDPKIKVVTLVKYYNFYLGHIAMQTV